MSLTPYGSGWNITLCVSVRPTYTINSHVPQRLSLSNYVFQLAGREFNSDQDFSHLSEAGGGYFQD